MKNDCLEAIDKHLALTIQVKEELLDEIVKSAEMIIAALKRGNKLLLCGNGGSAADAQHIAAEFIGRFVRERRSLPAIALTTDTSALTAIGNDYGFTQVFARQVEGLAVKGDVLIAISTSGDSSNVLMAVEVAHENGCSVIGLTGATGGKLSAVSDICLNVPVTETARIQEMHLLIEHLLCDLADKALAD